MSNVTPISTHHQSITLDAVLLAMQEWRNDKGHRPTSAIPTALWQKIFLLAKNHPPSKIRQILGLTKAQYDKKFAELFPTLQQPEAPKSESIDFCEVNPAAAKHKPYSEEVPSYIQVNTVIIELYRADGTLMKIHATSQSLKEIVNAFYTGAADVTNHRKA